MAYVGHGFAPPYSAKYIRGVIVVRIIKEGKLPEEKEYEVECQICKTLFSFKRGEAKYDSWRNEAYLSIKCPLCNRTVTKEI